jgi:hypothetical protein
MLNNKGTKSFTPTKTVNITIAGYSPANLVFNGIIDEVRLYNRALSDTEIKAIYDATK